MSDSLRLYPAVDRIAYVESLLDDAGLPTSDVRSKTDCFRVAVVGDAPVGTGGIEPLGSNGLLRSVVVAPSERGRGYGGALVEALADHAREGGIESLYLLTTTAADFFTTHGFQRVARESVPAPVRETAQFGELCPETATVMCKRL
jgi:amino-acid N-acetyltransferase